MLLATGSLKGVVIDQQPLGRQRATCITMRAIRHSIDTRITVSTSLAFVDALTAFDGTSPVAASLPTILAMHSMPDRYRRPGSGSSSQGRVREEVRVLCSVIGRRRCLSLARAFSFP